MSKIQSIPEYQELAARTCTDLEIEGKEEDFGKNERHMTLGVITEIGETLDIFKKFLAYKKPKDLVNLGEEIADISWYIVNTARFQEIPLDDNFEEVITDVKDYIENQLFSKKDLPLDLQTEAIFITLIGVYCVPQRTMFSAPIVQLAILSIICSWYNLDYFQCLTNNIDKLKVRYPEKFTEEAAQNRDLEAERKELEKEHPHDGDDQV